MSKPLKFSVKRIFFIHKTQSCQNYSNTHSHYKNR